MKTITCVVVMILLTLTAQGATNSVPSPAEQDRMLMEAVSLKQQARYADAEPLLKQLVEWQPLREDIQRLLTETQAARKAQEADPSKLLEQRLASIILPEINFREAVVRDVIEFLQREAQERAPDKKPINFVWLVPAEAQLSPITLTLRRTPLSEVIKYTTQLAGLRYRVDAHAVVIYKPEAPKAATP